MQSVRVTINRNFPALFKDTKAEGLSIMNNNSMRKKPLLFIKGEPQPAAEQCVIEGEIIQPKTEQYATDFNLKPRPYTSHSRRRYRSELKIKLLQITLGSLIFLFSLVALLMWLYISGLSVENERVSAKFHKQAEQLATVTAALKKLQSERDAWIQGRLPNLLPLEYDKAISLTEKYLHNIIFTLIKNQEKVATEYRVVLQNDTLSVIYPEVEILFFGNLGIQIGSAEITSDGATVDEVALNPGEIRSYSGPIELFRKESPRYFLVIAH
jgi:hypothetical protein